MSSRKILAWSLILTLCLSSISFAKETDIGADWIETTEESVFENIAEEDTPKDNIGNGIMEEDPAISDPIEEPIPVVEEEPAAEENEGLQDGQTEQNNPSEEAIQQDQVEDNVSEDVMNSQTEEKTVASAETEKTTVLEEDGTNEVQHAEQSSMGNSSELGQNGNTDYGISEFSVSNQDYTVEILADDNACLASDTQLFVSEYDQGSTSFAKRYQEAQKLYHWNQDKKDSIRLFDVSLLDSEGKEIEPEDTIQLTFSFNSEADDDISHSILHFSDNSIEIITPNVSIADGITTLSFALDSLSDIMILSDTFEDYDETEDQSTNSVTIIINWVDDDDVDDVRPNSATFKLIYQDPETGQQTTVTTMALSESEADQGGNVWRQTFTFDEEVIYNIFEEETYGASYYSYEITKTGDHEYTITATLLTELVNIDLSTQVGTNNSRTLNDGEYCHIDVRIDATFDYIYSGSSIALVTGTDVTVEKTWVGGVPDGTESLTFYVYQQNDDGSITQLYYDENGDLTTESTHEETSSGGPGGGMGGGGSSTAINNDPVTIVVSPDTGWTGSITLDYGEYVLVEEEVEGYDASSIVIETMPELEGGTDTFYTSTGTITVEEINWVMYELNGNDDGYVYGYIDGSYYGEPQLDSGDYEFFLDNNNDHYGRFLLYLTNESTIYVNIDFEYNYVDENGEVHDEVLGMTFEFDPEEWEADNRCSQKDATDTMRGVDLVIDGNVIMEQIMTQETSSEIQTLATNVNTLAAETVTLTGYKTWEDAVESEHDNDEEVSLIVSRKTKNDTSWTTLTEGVDYIVVWYDNIWSIYESGNPSSGYIGLPLTDDDGYEYEYQIEEAAVDGYSSTPVYDDITGELLGFVNTAEWSLEIVKENEYDEFLAGAVFSLQSDEYNATETTDANGAIVFEGLTAGTYVLAEEEAPEGYLPIDDSITLVVSYDNGYSLDTSEASNLPDGWSLSGNVLSITIIDEEIVPAWDLVLTKTDEKGDVLSGAKFTLSTTSGDIIESTDLNGQITFSDLETGIYVLTETEAPAGYLLLNDSITLVVDYEHGVGLSVNEAESSGLPDGWLFEDGVLSITVIDEAEPLDVGLPESGGSGMYAWIVFGLAIASASGMILFGLNDNKKRKYKSHIL